MKINKRLRQIDGRTDKTVQIEILWEDDVCFAFAIGADGRAWKAGTGRTEGQAKERLTMVGN